MKRTFVTISFVFYCIIVAAQNYSVKPESARLGLRQCIETGLKNNLDVLQSQLTMQSDKINMDQAKLNLLPDLNGAASHSFSQGRSIDPYSNTPVTQNVSASNFSLSSGVILFNGLALQNAIKQNSLFYEASKMDWQQVKDNLTINIILAYLQVLSADDQLGQAKNQAALSGAQVKRLEILNQQGAIRPSDLSDLKGQYATDQVDIINMQNTLETDKISLCNLMNIPYNPEMSLEPIEAESYIVKYESTREQIYQNALKELALVKAVDFRERSAEKGVKVERGRLFPTLSFGATISTNYSSVAQQNEYINSTYEPTTDTAIGNNIKLPVYRFQDNFTPYAKIPYMDQINNNVFTSYGFTLRVPIFNALVQRNRVKQAKLNLQNQHYVASTTRTELGRRVDQAYVNMLSAYDRYKVTLDQVTAFTESFRAAEIRFNSGVGTSVDYLVVKNSLDRANLALITAKYDYILRTKV